MSIPDLKKLDGYEPFPGPVVCVVMDGVGIGDRGQADGVHLAHTPVLDALKPEGLYTTLKAHGLAVGMPSDSDMGNSEVGHNALGAGRVFDQGAKLVGEALASGDAFRGDTWKSIVARGAAGGSVHFLGLLSDGNVHSHIDHLIALLGQCALEGIGRVRLHTLLDGRDVQERSALGYLDRLERELTRLCAGGCDYKIASGGGRMRVTMDRYDADWSMVERGWRTHVQGDARPFSSASEAVQTYYDEDPRVNDQYLPGFTIADESGPVGTIEDGDAVVLVNFRGDRAIEISRAFEEESLSMFDRVRRPDVFYAGMMLYDGDKDLPKHYLVEPPSIGGTLGEYLCTAGVTSLAVSETQKFGHVTYFWNGNKSGMIDADLERYVEVPSDNVVFDERPWMKAAEITDEAVEAVREGKRKFIRLNYPNGDMVGHTGNVPAIRMAVEAVDLGLGRLLRAVADAQGVAVVLADHGNADIMFTEKDGRREPMVAHTLNPVPCYIRDYTGSNRFELAEALSERGRGLSNIAATLLNLLGYEKPEEYDASLLAK